MASNGDVIHRWIEYVQGRATRTIGGSSNTVLAEGDTIYSYGRHFPMAEVIRPKDGNPFFLLNGDRYSVTTSHHQGMVRGAIGGFRGALTSWPSIIVPFSALGAAGIDHASIEPLEVTEDAWVTTEHSSSDIEDMPLPERTRWSFDTERAEPVKPDSDGLYHWTTGEHRLGESVFRARFRRDRPSARLCRGPFTGDVIASVHPYHMGYGSGIYTSQATRTWTRSCLRHYRATEPHRYSVREQGRATFLSGFDMQERPPVYFLAQLPAEAGER